MFKENVFFSLQENCKNTQKAKKGRDVGWQMHNGHGENPSELKSFLVLVLWIYIYIYRNITYILYLFLLVEELKGLPILLLRAWPCRKMPSPNYWQGLDMEALLALWLDGTEILEGTVNSHWRIRVKRCSVEDLPNQTTDKSILI